MSKTITISEDKFTSVVSKSITEIMHDDKNINHLIELILFGATIIDKLFDDDDKSKEDTE